MATTQTPWHKAVARAEQAGYRAARATDPEEGRRLRRLESRYNAEARRVYAQSIAQLQQV